MEDPEILRREIKVLAFDQYGTIVDMQKGLTETVKPFLKKKDWQGEPNSFVTWWRRTHFENSMIDALCDRGHTPYHQIGHRAVSYVMERCGISYTQDMTARAKDSTVAMRTPLSFEADGHTIFFKIDYYDKSCSCHSPDPSNPSVTERVITIMLAEEY